MKDEELGEIPQEIRRRFAEVGQKRHFVLGTALAKANVFPSSTTV